MGHYSHLSIEEREDIMVCWKNHESISQIARKLGRNKSSISREMKRNGWTIIGVAHLCYRASTAQRKTGKTTQTWCTFPANRSDMARKSGSIEGHLEHASKPA